MYKYKPHELLRNPNIPVIKINDWAYRLYIGTMQLKALDGTNLQKKFPAIIDVLKIREEVELQGQSKPRTLVAFSGGSSWDIDQPHIVTPEVERKAIYLMHALYKKHSVEPTLYLPRMPGYYYSTSKQYGLSSDPTPGNEFISLKRRHEIAMAYITFLEKYKRKNHQLIGDLALMGTSMGAGDAIEALYYYINGQPQGTVNPRQLQLLLDVPALYPDDQLDLPQNSNAKGTATIDAIINSTTMTTLQDLIASGVHVEILMHRQDKKTDLTNQALIKQLMPDAMRGLSQISNFNKSPSQIFTQDNLTIYIDSGNHQSMSFARHILYAHFITGNELTPQEIQQILPPS